VVGNTVSSSSSSVSVPECQLRHDLGDMLQNGLCSDITLCMQGQEFRAHKGVLAGMSQCYLIRCTTKLNIRVCGCVDQWVSMGGGVA